MVHVNNGVAAWEKGGVMEGRRQRKVRFCSETLREPWEALEQGRDGV